jgi:hypothetical protein
MQTAHIKEQDIDTLDLNGGLTTTRMFHPEVGERAEMLAGNANEVATRLIEIMQEHDVL